MESVLFTSKPIVALIVTLISTVLIILGRSYKLPQLSLLILGYSLIFLVYHTFGVNNADVIEKSPYYFSIAFDLIMLFLGLITYLWIDDIVANEKNKKSYSNDLSWFWNKL